MTRASSVVEYMLNVHGSGFYSAPKVMNTFNLIVLRESEAWFLKKSLLFQNSMRATVELHENRKEGYPAVKTLVTLGKEDLSIKVNFCFHFTLVIS